MGHSSPVPVTTAGLATPRIIVFTMFRSGRDDRIEEIGKSPLKPKAGLEWAIRPTLMVKIEKAA